MSVKGAHVREVRVARSTGATVECRDQTHPDADTELMPLQNGRWAVICLGIEGEADHAGECQQRSSWREARALMGKPETWCAECKKLAGAGPRPSKDPFMEEDRKRAQQARSAKAAERRQEREEEKRHEQEAQSLEAQWSRFIIEKPLDVDNVWEDREMSEREKLKVKQMAATAEKRQARREVRKAEAELAEIRKDPPLAEDDRKKYRKMERELEARITAMEAWEDEAADVAAQCQTGRDRLANLTWLRGAEEEGWAVHKNGSGFYVQKGRQKITLPRDFLPDRELKEVAR